MQRDVYVYVIEFESIGRVKIGSSAWPDTRLKTIQQNSPVACRLIAQWPGTRDEEFALHARFDAHRAYRECFEVAGELADWLATVRGLGLDSVEPWPGRYHDGREERERARRESQGQKIRAYWADPEWRERQLRQLARSHAPSDQAVA